MFSTVVYVFQFYKVIVFQVMFLLLECSCYVVRNVSAIPYIVLVCNEDELEQRLKRFIINIPLVGTRILSRVHKSQLQVNLAS